MQKCKAAVKAHVDNFMKYRFLLKELTSKNIKLQYRNSVLGVFWTFLDPLLTMIVLSFVFNVVFGKNSEEFVNYPVYLLCGKLLYEFYKTGSKRAMVSIRSRASIIKKVYVPKYIYPLSNVFSAFVNFAISLIVLVVVIAFFNVTNYHPINVTWRIIYAIIPILVLFVLTLGVGMILATVSVFFKDVENLYDVFCILLFYLSPIVYRPKVLNFPPSQLRILKINPLYGLIDCFRAAIIWGADFTKHWDARLLTYDTIFAFVCLIIGFAIFYKNQDKFILHI